MFYLEHKRSINISFIQKGIPNCTYLTKGEEERGPPPIPMTLSYRVQASSPVAPASCRLPDPVTVSTVSTGSLLSPVPSSPPRNPPSQRKWSP